MTHRIVVGALTVVTLCVATHVAAQDKAKIECGMKVYEQQKCSLCHSIEGKGSKADALDGVGGKLTADEIRQWLVKPAEMTAKTRPPGSRR
jgi:mono/diheme cytochrome c family protein